MGWKPDEGVEVSELLRVLECAAPYAIKAFKINMSSRTGLLASRDKIFPAMLVTSAFEWRETPEGYDYWDEVNNWYRQYLEDWFGVPNHVESM